MPKINVYLPDVQAAAVKEAGVPVSAVCQAALADAVERVGRLRRAVAALRDPATPAASLEPLSGRLRARMTPRLLAALELAAPAPGEGGDSEAPVVTTLDLLAGLVEEGGNLAVRLLAAQQLDPEALSAECRAIPREEPAPRGGAAGGSLLGRLTVPARAACAAALELVVELGHNYVGCEHLLVGLTTAEGQAAELLARQGLRPEPLVQHLKGAIAGVAYERESAPDRTASALAGLARRLEAVERQLAGSQP